MDNLRDAVERGLVTVTRTKGGHLVSGAVHDLLIRRDLEDMGAQWDEGRQAYFVSEAEGGRGMERIERRSKAVAAAVAARMAAARRDGVKMFDLQRARYQRKMAREIRAVYEKALDEHRRELNRVMERYANAADPVEAIKLGYRRDELESVMDGLAAGLANAGASAAALTDSALPQAAATSRYIASWQLDRMAGFRVSRFLAHDTSALALTGIGTYHGKFDLKAWDGVADKAKCRKIIKESVSRGLLTGEHPTKIAERMEGLFTGDTPLSPYKRALRIAQTETASIMNEGILETMRTADAAGLKMKKRWDATLDGSTRKDHRKVDGETVGLEEKFSNGLAGPGDGGAADRINCRCCLVEELDGFKPDFDMRRDNITGQATANRSYYAWAVEEGRTDMLDADELAECVRRGYMTQRQADAIISARR